MLLASIKNNSQWDGIINNACIKRSSDKSNSGLQVRFIRSLGKIAYNCIAKLNRFLKIELWHFCGSFSTNFHFLLVIKSLIYPEKMFMGTWILVRFIQRQRFDLPEVWFTRCLLILAKKALFWDLKNHSIYPEIRINISEVRFIRCWL